MSVRALNRLFISAPFLLLLFRNEARGTFVPLGGAATLIAPRLERLWPFYDQRLNPPQLGARVGPTRVAPPSTTSVWPVM
jgi:hypothetical protein